MNPDAHRLGPRKTVRVRPFFLDEAFLGFLAIVAVALTLIPVLFKLSAQGRGWIEASQWVIILFFAIEYGLSFAAAKSKRRFILDPWRLIDVSTILIPLVTLLPGVSNWLRSTPVLRLIRIARLLSLGVRASGVIVRKEESASAVDREEDVQVCILPSGEGAEPRKASWEDFVQWAKHPGSEWYSVANVGKEHLAKIAKATKISSEFIASHLFAMNYPHLEVTDRFVSLFVQMPRLEAGQQIERDGLLVLASATSIITFARRPAGWLDQIPQKARGELAGFPFPVRMICHLLKLVLDANETLVGGLEQQLQALEELPVRESRPYFFEQTFRLKKQLSAAQADLWRLRGVLKELAESRVKLPGDDSRELPFLRDLAETADYLYETVNQVREEVLSLIDLHLNVVSFEMNRVMRVLAVVSVLGLIPAVVGGLFGMNLVDNPWPLTLPQVTFAVGMAMITCLYFFVVKGWLR